MRPVAQKYCARCCCLRHPRTFATSAIRCRSQANYFTLSSGCARLKERRPAHDVAACRALAQQRSAGTWARIDGQRPHAVVIHPRLPGDAEELVAWDAAEAVALGKALGWRVLGSDQAESADSEEEEGSSETEEEEEEAVLDGRSVYISDDHILRLDRVDPRFFLPVADLSRAAVRLARARADILFINATLTPTQQRSLEAAMDLAARARRSADGEHGRSKGRRVGGRAGADSDRALGEAAGGGIAVFDRTRVVLAIFARRASSPLAKHQVELAEAQHLRVKLGAAAMQGISSQLQRVADALARRVPGCDRGALLPRDGAAKGVSQSFNSSPQKTKQKLKKGTDDKERRIGDETARLKAHRTAQRRKRQHLRTIALVGYTNVGKSALVNKLSGSDLLVRDGVFVTLDIAARRIPLPSGSECYILDSVGFIKDLPMQLCDAFKATVEELRAADLVLHVRDMSHPSRDEHAQLVVGMLDAVGIDRERHLIEVWNKCDLLNEKELRRLKYQRGSQEGTSIPLCTVSALHGDGLGELIRNIDDQLSKLGNVRGQGASEVQQRSLRRIHIPADLPADVATEVWSFLRAHCSVVEESIAAEGDSVSLEAWMDEAAAAGYGKRFGGTLAQGSKE